MGIKIGLTFEVMENVGLGQIWAFCLRAILLALNFPHKFMTESHFIAVNVIIFSLDPKVESFEPIKFIGWWFWLLRSVVAVAWLGWLREMLWWLKLQWIWNHNLWLLLPLLILQSPLKWLFNNIYVQGNLLVRLYFWGEWGKMALNLALGKVRLHAEDVFLGGA